MKNIQNYFILISIVCLSQIATAQLTITEIGTLPEPISNNSVCEGFINEVPYLFSFAGIDSTKIFSGTHLKSFRVNLETGVSEQIADLPGDQGLLATGASRIGNIIYIVGGYTVNSNGSEVSSRKVRRYDIDNNEYLSDAADLIVPTDDHVQAVWRDSLLYVITGWSNSGNIRFTQVYDPVSDSWTNGTLLPDDNDFTSFGASGTIIEDQILYFGGARSSGNFPIQNLIRIGDIDPNNPSNVSWSIVYLDGDMDNCYRSAATSVFNAAHWVGGSNNTYNYNGIAYDGSGGVPTSNQDFVSAENILFERTVLDSEIPMDLRGIAKVSETVQYIAGGMLADQKVSDKVFKLEFDITVVPAVKYTAADLGISIFPNPVSSQLNINNDGDERVVLYKLINSNGDLMGVGKTAESISVSDVSAGIYLLELILKSGIKVMEEVFVVK